jgi:hypothetical protein
MKEEVILRTLAQESLGVGVMVENIWSFEVLGLFCKIPGIIDFGLVFELKNLWARSTGRGPLEPWSTVDRSPLPAGGAHRSPTYGPSGALGQRPRGGGGEWSMGDPLGRSLEAGRG